MKRTKMRNWTTRSWLKNTRKFYFYYWVNFKIFRDVVEHLINCHLVYIIACAKTKKLLYVGKSNNGIFRYDIREKLHCRTSLGGKENKSPSQEV